MYHQQVNIILVVVLAACIKRQDFDTVSALSVTDLLMVRDYRRLL
jgi:hypothetical protein